MPTYKVRVKPNRTYGAKKSYKAGDELVVTEDEVRAFGDKLEVIETLDASESPAPEPVPEPAPKSEAEAQVDKIVQAVKAALGKHTADQVELEDVQDLQERMKRGDVPKVDEVVGPATTRKLVERGMDDPIVLYYASDGDITAIPGVGIGMLRRLRKVYGKAGD